MPSVHVCVKVFWADRRDREKQVDNIIAGISALLNSGGGTLRVVFDVPSYGNHLRELSRAVEQKLVQTLGHLNACRLIVPVDANGELAFDVDGSPVLCTVNYNLFFPTGMQIISIPPCEPSANIKNILCQEDRGRIIRGLPCPESEHLVYIFNERFPLSESHCVQFKSLKSEKSKCVSLADRMVSKSNKLMCYISAFANSHGGRLYYGISQEGIVEGQALRDKDQGEITRKITKLVKKMIWCGGELLQGKHWDIQFKEIKDEKMEIMPFLFVVVVSVKPLIGGLFTKEPESYHVVHGQVARMPFAEWCSRFFGQSQPCRSVYGVAPGRSYACERENFFGLVGWQLATESTVASEQHLQAGKSEEAGSEWTNAALGASNDTPSSVLGSTVSRGRWSSEKKQKVYHQLSEKLVKYRNDSSEAEFEVFARMAERSFPQYDAHLIVLAERIAYAYRTGHYRKAQSLLHEYETSLSSSSSADISIFQFKAVYAKSAIARTQGQYEESYNIAVEGLQLAQLIPAGIATAWFYNHLATLEAVLSQTGKEESANDMLKKAGCHYITALQHAEASSVEREFFTSLADLRQRVHINRAIMLSGHCVSGNKRALGARSCDIKSAKEALGVLHHISLNGYSKTWFREIQYYLALCDLGVCQWWQLMQQQQLEQQRQQQRRHQSQSSDKILDPLMVAFGYSKKAVKLAKDCHFEEMTSYAEKRVAVLTETILRHKVSQLNLPRNTVGNTVD